MDPWDLPAHCPIRTSGGEAVFLTLSQVILISEIREPLILTGSECCSLLQNTQDIRPFPRWPLPAPPSPTRPLGHPPPSPDHSFCFPLSSTVRFRAGTQREPSEGPQGSSAQSSPVLPLPPRAMASSFLKASRTPYCPSLLPS